MRVGMVPFAKAGPEAPLGGAHRRDSGYFAAASYIWAT